MQSYRNFHFEKKNESYKDVAIGRAFVLRMGVQIRPKTDLSLFMLDKQELELGDELLSDVPCFMQ